MKPQKPKFTVADAIAHQQRHGFSVDHFLGHPQSAQIEPVASFQPPTRPDTPPKRLRGLSKRKPTKAELQYSLILSRELSAGTIHSFQEQSLTLVIGEGCRYTPDFSVWLLDGQLKCIEVKGKQIWEDAIVKYKTAVRQYPKIKFEFWQLLGQQWTKLL